MVRIKKTERSLRLLMDEGQELVFSTIKSVEQAIESIESDGELDFHQSRGIIDILAAFRRDMLYAKESRCLRSSSSTPSSRLNTTIS